MVKHSVSAWSLCRTYLMHACYYCSRHFACSSSIWRGHSKSWFASYPKYWHLNVAVRIFCKDLLKSSLKCLQKNPHLLFPFLEFRYSLCFHVFICSDGIPWDGLILVYGKHHLIVQQLILCYFSAFQRHIIMFNRIWKWMVKFCQISVKFCIYFSKFKRWRKRSTKKKKK